MFRNTTLMRSPTSPLMIGPINPRCCSLKLLVFLFVNDESVYSTYIALMYVPPILLELLWKNVPELQLITLFR